MKKKHIISVIVVVVLILGGFGFRYLYKLNKYKKTISNFQLEDFDLNNIADGIYVGECDVDYIYVKLNTTVENNKITKIEIVEHKNGKGAPAESIVDEIIKKQSLEVDNVSGATNSSKVIKEAIKNSLKQ